MSADDDRYPEFSEAEQRFRRFLASERMPSDIRWVNPTDVALADGHLFIRPPQESRRRGEASEIYDAAATRRYGVKLNVLGWTGGIAWCFVWAPEDELASAFALMADCVKYSFPNETERSQVAVVKNSLRWWWIKRRGRLSEIPLESLFH